MTQNRTSRLSARTSLSTALKSCGPFPKQISHSFRHIWPAFDDPKLLKGEDIKASSAIAQYISRLDPADPGWSALDPIRDRSLQTPLQPCAVRLKGEDNAFTAVGADVRSAALFIHVCAPVQYLHFGIVTRTSGAMHKLLAR